MGHCEGQTPDEPVAWTRLYQGGRVFYTSLGHPGDFELQPFRRMLLHAVFWALDRPVSEKEAKHPAASSSSGRRKG
jgi:type 1 glutamine amidotransferase